MGENNTLTALKGCGVKMMGNIESISFNYLLKLDIRYKLVCFNLLSEKNISWILKAEEQNHFQSVCELCRELQVVSYSGSMWR